MEEMAGESVLILRIICLNVIGCYYWNLRICIVSRVLLDSVHMLVS